MPAAAAVALGAPPDGFLIDGHNEIDPAAAPAGGAHRLTGFSSMDTKEHPLIEPVDMAHRLTGFSSMDTYAKLLWAWTCPPAHRLTGFSSMDTRPPPPWPHRIRGRTA